MRPDKDEAAPAEPSPNLPAPVSNIDALSVDPIFMKRLASRNVQVSTLGIVVIAVTAVAVSWCALASSLMYSDAHSAVSYGRYIISFLRGRIAVRSARLPLFDDIPSLLLAATIPISFTLVFDLFKRVQVMHTLLAGNECIRASGADEGLFNRRVEDLNTSLAKFGKWSPLALAVCLLAAIGTLVGQSKGLFGSGPEFGLYRNWWASAKPFRPGAVVWVFLGTVGFYTVYIEAVLGVKYVQFIRRVKESEQFSANALNPDGYYGWRSLRDVLSNMEIGIVLTGISSVALWPFLHTASGLLMAGVTEATFIGVVAYVFFGSPTALRKLVDEDRRRQILEIQSSISNPGTNIESLLRTTIEFQRLALVDRLPNSPLRRGSFVILGLSLLAPILEILVAMLHYFNK